MIFSKSYEGSLKVLQTFISRRCTIVGHVYWDYTKEPWTNKEELSVQSEALAKPRWKENKDLLT